MMKLKYLFALPALAAALVGCDEIEMSDAKPVENPQLGIFETSDLAISQEGLGESAPIALQTLADNGETVKLAKVTKLENFPEDFDLVFDVQMSMSADFAQVANVSATVDNEMIVTTPGDVEAAIKQFTNDPATKTVYARYAGYATNSNSQIRLGGPDYYCASYTYQITPMAPAQVMAAEYNLRYRENANGEWKTVALVKSNKDQSVYDNGMFSAAVTITEPGFEWTVQPVGTNEVWGVAAEEATAASGTLVAEDAQANVISGVGPYLVIVDVLNMTFSVSIDLDYVSVPYNTGSSITASQWSKFLHLIKGDNSIYSGTVLLYQNWFLSGMPGTEGVYFMNDGTEAEYDEETFTTTGTLAQLGEFNPDAKLAIADPCLVYMTFDMINLKYSYTKLNAISLIGSLNDWNLETAIDLTHKSSAAQFTHWTVSGVHMEAGTEYKFCVNHAWTYSYGGAVDNIVQNGGNLVMEEEGTYDFELDFSVQPNVLKITKK